MWQQALRNVVYRNTAAGGAATMGTRAVVFSLGSTAPSECRSNYGSAAVNLVTALSTRSASETASQIPSPSITSTPIDLGALGSPTVEPTLGPESGARNVAVTAAAGLVAVAVAAALL